MSDIFSLATSEQPQSVQMETPFENKQYNFIQDINSNVYTNTQASLVQFNLGSLYNSNSFIDTKECYLVIPMVYTAAYTIAGGALVAPLQNVGQEWMLTPKSGSWNLIQSVELVLNGKTVIQQITNSNFHTNFKMLSQMSKDDLQAFGQILGMYPDDVQSYQYNITGAGANIGCVNGNGLTNNNILPINAAGEQGVPNMDESGLFAANYCSNGSVYNSALQKRSFRIANNLSTGQTINNGMMNLLGEPQFNNEFRPYFMVTGNYMNWVDYAIVRLRDICDFFDKCPLVKQIEGLLRIYVNTGCMSISCVGNPDSFGAMYLSGANSTFQNTCPFLINQLPCNAEETSIPASATTLTICANIAKTSSSFNGVNLAAGGGSAAMNGCRLYFTQIKMKPEIALKYLESNRSKEIVYTNILGNNFQNIANTVNFSALVQSGVRNIRGVLILPFLSSKVNGTLSTTTGIVSFNTFSSPFDTSPCTTPCSLTQLQVLVGGTNLVQNFYNYTYENYLQQTVLYDKINQSEMGISCGLLSMQMWEAGYRYYYFDCSRGTDADNNAPRNINISFYQNTAQPVDVYVFVEYFETRNLDCASGELV